MNKVKQFYTSVITALFLFAHQLIAQNSGQPPVEMADALRASGKIYVVVVVLTIIFAGIITFLLLIDRRLKKLEKE